MTDGFSVYKSGESVNTARIDFKGQYTGQYAVVKTNPKMRVLNGLASGDEARIFASLPSIVVEHNLIDDEGVALPRVFVEDTAGELPVALYLQLLEGINEAVQAAPWFPKAAAKTGE